MLINYENDNEKILQFKLGYERASVVTKMTFCDMICPNFRHKVRTQYLKFDPLIIKILKYLTRGEVK